MRLKFFRLVFFCATFLPFSAMAQDVAYNYAQDVNFSQFKTYKWVNIGDDVKPNQLLDNEIKQAIETQLANKGLTQSEDNAQLLISYQAFVTQEKQITAFNSGGDWGYGPGWPYGYAFYGGPSITTATTSTIHIGNLILNIYDAGKKDLVWRGEMSKTLNPSTNPEKNRKNLNKAIAKLLNYYPPQPRK
jgi:hypothetical protein